MSIQMAKRHIMVGSITLVVSLSTALYTAAAQSAGILASTQRTVTRDLIVQGTAEASVSITPKTSILAGAYENSNRQVLASYTASVTGGTLAMRFNSSVVDPYNSSPTGGYLKNAVTPTIRMSVALTYPSGTTTNNGWRVFPEGTQEYTGTIVTYLTQTISGGRYPVALDAIAWLY